ncbi:hypothetical protein H4S08_002885 [Coemansia sp. RSA 1365]|nr:hypothetical protein H4S08_002885 [Coemansia sp. RSA 1365]
MPSHRSTPVVEAPSELGSVVASDTELMEDALDEHGELEHWIQSAQKATDGMDAGDAIPALLQKLVGPKSMACAYGTSAEKQFLVIIDQTSGFIAATPANIRNAVEAVSIVHNFWVRPFRLPTSMTSDNAWEFHLYQMQRNLGSMGIKFQPSSPHNPQGNIAETAVKKAKDGLQWALTDAGYSRVYLEGGWTGLLDAVVHNWNVSPSASTGSTPATIFFGQRICHPLDRQSNLAVPIGYPADSDSGVNSAELQREAMLECREDQQQLRAAFFNWEEQCLVFPVGSQVLRCSMTVGPLNQHVIRTTGPYLIYQQVSDTNY